MLMESCTPSRHPPHLLSPPHRDTISVKIVAAQRRTTNAPYPLGLAPPVVRVGHPPTPPCPPIALAFPLALAFALSLALVVALALALAIFLAFFSFAASLCRQGRSTRQSTHNIEGRLGLCRWLTALPFPWPRSELSRSSYRSFLAARQYVQRVCAAGLSD